MVYPEKLNWANSSAGLPISILHSGTQFDISTNDWPDAMQWLKENTAEDAVIAAWWDYGYWISTLSERKTLADNATVLDWQIRKLASMYMSTPEDAWQILTSDAETDVGLHYVTLPGDFTYPTRHSDDVYDLEVRKLEVFAEWQMGDSNGNGITNKEEGDDWKIGPRIGELGPCGQTGPCAKYRVNPGTIEQYPTLFDYWKSEVYVIPPVVTGLDADFLICQSNTVALSAKVFLSLRVLIQYP